MAGRRPMGIFAMLDEEVVLPNGSDSSLIVKLHRAFADKGPTQHRCSERRQQQWWLWWRACGAGC